MSLFAIRDDDTSFWTAPDELEIIYRPLWAENIPVSLAVIPAAVKSLYLGDPSKFYQELEVAPIENNLALVTFLQQKVRVGAVEIMLHGFDHFYQVAENPGIPGLPAEKQNIERLRSEHSEKVLVWRGEYAWKDSTRLFYESAKGKDLLENLLQCKIRVFVPPGNQITKAGIRAIEALNLDISGIVGLSPSRGLSFAYLRRWLFRLRTGRLYPFALDYGVHRELVAYALTPRASLNGLTDALYFCARLGAPFVLATHYWELNQHPPLREALYQLCAEARRIGFRFGTVSQCLRNNR